VEGEGAKKRRGVEKTGASANTFNGSQKSSTERTSSREMGRRKGKWRQGDAAAIYRRTLTNVNSSKIRVSPKRKAGAIERKRGYSENQGNTVEREFSQARKPYDSENIGEFTSDSRSA